MGSFPVALPFLGLFFLYFIINYITTSVRAYKFKRSHGCQPAPRYPQRERILGLELFKTVKRSVVEKRSLDAGLERSLEIGSTYSAVSMGRLIVVTMDPDNVKAVLATNFKDYSLGERLLAFNPLLGSGIFTTDGVHWEHSRVCVLADSNCLMLMFGRLSFVRTSPKPRLPTLTALKHMYSTLSARSPEMEPLLIFNHCFSIRHWIVRRSSSSVSPFSLKQLLKDQRRIVSARHLIMPSPSSSSVTV